MQMKALDEDIPYTMDETQHSIGGAGPIGDDFGKGGSSFHGHSNGGDGDFLAASGQLSLPASSRRGTDGLGTPAQDPFMTGGLPSGAGTARRSLGGTAASAAARRMEGSGPAGAFSHQQKNSTDFPPTWVEVWGAPLQGTEDLRQLQTACDRFGQAVEIRPGPNFACVRFRTLRQAQAACAASGTDVLGSGMPVNLTPVRDSGRLQQLLSLTGRGLVSQGTRTMGGSGGGLASSGAGRASLRAGGGVTSAGGGLGDSGVSEAASLILRMGGRRSSRSRGRRRGGADDGEDGDLDSLAGSVSMGGSMGARSRRSASRSRGWGRESGW